MPEVASDVPSQRALRPDRGRSGLVAFGVGFAVLAALRHWNNLPNGVLEVVSVGTAVAGVAVGLREGRRLVFLRRFLVLALAFGLVALLSVTQSPEPEAAFEAWVRLSMVQSLGLGCYLLTSDRHRLRWFTLGAMAGVGFLGLAGAGVIPVGSLPLRRVDDGGRLTGPVGDPNFFGQYLAIGLALAMGLLIAERRLVLQLFGAAVAGGVLVSALATESRGTLLAMVVAGAVVFLFASHGVRVTICVLFALAVLAAPADAVNSTFGRLARAPSAVDEALDSGSPEDTAVGGRLSEAIASVHMIRDHPVLGVGIGSYRYRYRDYAVDIGIDRRAEERDAHNRHLEVAAETGIPGIVVWIWLLVTCASLCRRSVRRRDVTSDLRGAAIAWTAAFAAWVVTAFFLHDYQPDVEWLVIGAVFGMAESVRATPGPLRGAQRAESMSSSYSATSSSAAAVRA